MRRFRGGNPELVYFQFVAEGFYSHRVGEVVLMQIPTIGRSAALNPSEVPPAKRVVKSSVFIRVHPWLTPV